MSHTTPSTAFRGFGVPQISWARESNLDEAARTLGIDPLQLRLRNLPAHREEFIPGETPAEEQSTEQGVSDPRHPRWIRSQQMVREGG